MNTKQILSDKIILYSLRVILIAVAILIVLYLAMYVYKCIYAITLVNDITENYYQSINQ